MPRQLSPRREIGRVGDFKPSKRSGCVDRERQVDTRVLSKWPESQRFADRSAGNVLDGGCVPPLPPVPILFDRCVLSRRIRSSVRYDKQKSNRVGSEAQS